VGADCQSSIKSRSCDSVARLFAHLHLLCLCASDSCGWGNMLRGWRCVYLPHSHDRCLNSSLRKIIHVWHKLRNWLVSGDQSHLYTFLAICWDETEMSACCTLFPLPPLWPIFPSPLSRDELMWGQKFESNVKMDLAVITLKPLAWPMIPAGLALSGALTGSPTLSLNCVKLKKKQTGKWGGWWGVPSAH